MLLNLTVSFTSSDVTTEKGFTVFLLGHFAHIPLFIVSAYICVCSHGLCEGAGPCHRADAEVRGQMCRAFFSSYLYVDSRIELARVIP